jgi:hypothetical protein
VSWHPQDCLWMCISRTKIATHVSNGEHEGFNFYSLLHREATGQYREPKASRRDNREPGPSRKIAVAWGLSALSREARKKKRVENSGRRVDGVQTLADQRAELTNIRRHVVCSGVLAVGVLDGRELFHQSRERGRSQFFFPPCTPCIFAQHYLGILGAISAGVHSASLRLYSAASSSTYNILITPSGLQALNLSPIWQVWN